MRAMTSPNAMNAIADGTTKYAIWRSPPSSFARRNAEISSWLPTAARRISGSCAADTAIPNRLTGKT